MQILLSDTRDFHWPNGLDIHIGEWALDLETWLQIHTNISNFEMASPKTII